MAWLQRCGRGVIYKRPGFPSKSGEIRSMNLKVKKCSVTAIKNSRTFFNTHPSRKSQSFREAGLSSVTAFPNHLFPIFLEGYQASPRWLKASAAPITRSPAALADLSFTPAPTAGRTLGSLFPNLLIGRPASLTYA